MSITIPEILTAIRRFQDEDIDLCDLYELKIARIIVQEFADKFQREIEERTPLSIFTWDELTCEIRSWTADSVLDNGVEVWTTDNHVGLNVRARSREEADEKFSEYPLYRECMKAT